MLRDQGKAVTIKSRTTSSVSEWIDYRLPIFTFLRRELHEYPTPRNLNYLWWMRFAKVNLQQGLAVSEQAGQPISGKFEIDRGKFQLSVYTSKDGKFSEVLVDYSSGNVANVEPI